MSDVIWTGVRDKVVGVHAYGATAGESVRNFLRPLLAHRLDEPAVLLDFAGIESTTASFLKRTYGWLARESMQHARGETSEVCVYPAVSNLSEDVSEELSEFAMSQQLPVLEALDWTSSAITIGRVRGPLDSTLRQTLALVAARGEVTASELQQGAGDSVSVTAWNNRLAELYRLRLVRRTKRARFYYFSTITGELRHG
jgi:hypothetical protein